MFNEANLFECRGCLQPCSNEDKRDLFKSWYPPWPGMENTLAEDLSKLACIQVCMKNISSSEYRLLLILSFATLILYDSLSCKNILVFLKSKPKQVIGCNPT